MLKTLRSKWKTDSSAVHLQRLAERAAASIGEGEPVLHLAPPEFLFPSLFARYIGIDSSGNGPLDPLCRRTGDEPYALILCTHAIEHATEPLAALTDLHAALKPGGRLWLTAPLYYMEHQQPDDYARFTRSGLRRLLEKAGFEVEEIQWLEGYCGTLAYSFRMAFEGLPVSPRSYGGGLGGICAAVFVNAIVRPTSAVFATVLYRLDLRHKHLESGFCKSYQVIARRPN